MVSLISPLIATLRAHELQDPNPRHKSWSHACGGMHWISIACGQATLSKHLAWPAVAPCPSFELSAFHRRGSLNIADMHLLPLERAGPLTGGWTTHSSATTCVYAFNFSLVRTFRYQTTVHHAGWLLTLSCLPHICRLQLPL